MGQIALMEHPSRTFQDRMDPERATALRLALGAQGDAFPEGDHLPIFWHGAYFWDVASDDQLGDDGHRRSGEFIPDFGLKRRMWVGGSVVMLRPLVLGRAASLTESISRTRMHDKRHAFVELRRIIKQDGETILIECKNLAYLNVEHDQNRPPFASPAQWTERRHKTFTSPMLFRYSAITMNSHRIHYDADYCRDVEGYPGLVVPGPLLCTQILEQAREQGGAVTKFSYRALAPVICGEEVSFFAHHQAGRLGFWVSGADDRLCMVARVQSQAS